MTVIARHRGSSGGVAGLGWTPPGVMPHPSFGCTQPRVSLCARQCLLQQDPPGLSRPHGLAMRWRQGPSSGCRCQAVRPSGLVLLSTRRLSVRVSVRGSRGLCIKEGDCYLRVCLRGFLTGILAERAHIPHHSVSAFKSSCWSCLELCFFSGTPFWVPLFGPFQPASTTLAAPVRSIVVPTLGLTRAGRGGRGGGVVVLPLRATRR